MEKYISCSISNIKKYVCDFFGIQISKLDSYCKTKNIALSRQIAKQIEILENKCSSF